MFFAHALSILGLTPNGRHLIQTINHTHIHNSRRAYPVPVKSLLGLLLFFSLSITTPAWAQTTRNPEHAAASDQNIEYRLLATSKTSTMEREMNEAAREGFRFEGLTSSPA
jgi:hypothetical protein